MKNLQSQNKIQHSCDYTIIFNYGNNSYVFHKVNRLFSKMDKKNVQN
uniref:Uncharacterized protein n=1 Tax=viral metagenome TaxID=1070528 RepID=A0A6C0DHX2_9ZZZZ